MISPITRPSPEDTRIRSESISPWRLGWTIFETLFFSLHNVLDALHLLHYTIDNQCGSNKEKEKEREHLFLSGGYTYRLHNIYSPALFYAGEKNNITFATTTNYTLFVA